MVTVKPAASLDDLWRLNAVVHAWHARAYPEHFRTDAQQELGRYLSAARFVEAVGFRPYRHYLYATEPSAPGHNAAGRGQ